MKLLAIDPGPKKSGYVVWDGQMVVEAGTENNQDLLNYIQWGNICGLREEENYSVIEQIKSLGMAVSDSVFDTVFWTGRFFQALEDDGLNPDRMPRKDVKMYLCNSMRARDSNINCELRNRYGEKPTKKRANPVFGDIKLKGDEWAAFALAVTYWDTVIKCG